MLTQDDLDQLKAFLEEEVGDNYDFESRNTIYNLAAELKATQEFLVFVAEHLKGFMGNQDAVNQQLAEAGTLSTQGGILVAMAVEALEAEVSDLRELL
jgi:hypothetical protein